MVYINLISDLLLAAFSAFAKPSLLPDWYFCTSDQEKADSSFYLSVCLCDSAKTGRKMTDSRTHTPLFVHCTPGSKSSPGESISSKIRQHSMPPQIQLSSLCLTHVLTHALFIGQRSWPHKCSFNLSHTHKYN